MSRGGGESEGDTKWTTESPAKSESGNNFMYYFHEMNRSTNIKVETPVGLTDTKELGPSVAQGSVDASVISSASLASGVEDEFTDPSKEIMYADLVIFPTIYMDDCNKLSNIIEAAQYANDKMEVVVGKKNLTLNIDKSVYTVLGNKKARKAMKAKLSENPLKLQGNTMKEAKSIKILGDFLSQDLEESVHQMVVKRVVMARFVMYEIRTTVEDIRA